MTKKKIATAFIAEIEAEVEALLGQGTSEALDLEAWETAARHAPCRCPVRVLRRSSTPTPATTGDPGCLANAAGRRAMRDESASASPASWVRWCWSEPTTTASGVSQPGDREQGGSFPGAVRMVGTAAARVSFAESSQLLAELAGLRIDPKRVERAAEALGGEIAEDECLRVDRNRPRPRRWSWALDGTGVPVRPGEPRAVRASSPTGPPRRARSSW